MKQLAICLFFMLLQSTGFSQVVAIPESTKKSFKGKYPKAANTIWKNNVTNYTASFSSEGSNFVAHYHLDGTWKYTEKIIDKADLPKAVIASYHKSRIAKLEYVSSAYIENSHQEKAYRIEARKGLEKIFIFYDKNGQEIKSLKGI